MEEANVWTRSGSILVVDDDPEILHLISTFLSDAGHAVSSARSGFEALDLLTEKTFDLAILDLRMPGMDGFELCRQIRTRERERRMPVVFLTAHYDESEWSVKAREMGADDFLLKPVTRRALLARVGSILRLVQASGSAPGAGVDRGSLAALRAIFETMLESTPACVLALDDTARVISAAGKILEILGTPIVPGSALDTAVPAEILQNGPVLRLVQNALLGAKDTPFTMHAQTARGTRLCRITARPVPTALRGGPIRAVLVIEDITDASPSDDGAVVDLGVADFAAAAAEVAQHIEQRSAEVLSGLRALGETGEQLLRLAEGAANEVSTQLSLASLRVYWRRVLKQSAVGAHEILKMARDLRGNLPASSDGKSRVQ